MTLEVAVASVAANGGHAMHLHDQQPRGRAGSERESGGRRGDEEGAHRDRTASRGFRGDQQTAASQSKPDFKTNATIDPQLKEILDGGAPITAPARRAASRRGRSASVRALGDHGRSFR